MDIMGSLDELATEMKTVNSTMEKMTSAYFDRASKVSGGATTTTGATSSSSNPGGASAGHNNTASSLDGTPKGVGAAASGGVGMTSLDAGDSSGGAMGMPPLNLTTPRSPRMKGGKKTFF